MSFWQIIIPQAAQNLVAYPTPTAGSTGYTAAGATLATDSTLTRRGTNCFKLTPTSANFDGFYYSVNLTSGSTYYASCDIFGAAGVNYQIFFASGGSTPLGTAGSTTGTGYWAANRPVATYTAGGTGTYRVYIAKNNSASTAPFWVDGVMVQTAGSNCTYIDGNQAGCSWDATKNASTSTRSNQTREGGLLVDFDTYALSVSEYDGIGMPDMTNVMLMYGLQDGAYYQRSKAKPRTFALKSTVNTAPSQSNPTWTTLQTNRKNLINAVKHDAIGQDAPFILRYTGAGKPMQIRAVYNDGLASQMGAAQGFTERLSSSFIAPDPFWWEEGNSVSVSAGSVTTGSVGSLLFRDLTGTWQNLGSNLTGGLFAYVQTMVQLQNGKILMGGNWGLTNGTTGSAIALWDPVASTWAVPGGGVGANDVVRDITMAATGVAYACGDFTTINGTAYSHVAAYTPGTNSWSAVGTGTNGLTMSVLATNDGFLYACGSFTTAGGTAASNIARWNGATWSAIGNANGMVRTMVMGPDGYVYAGGDFTTIGGVSAAGIARFDGFNWYALGAGTGSGALGIGAPSVRALLFDASGKLYAGGSFYALNGVVLHSLGIWNGSIWSPCGIGLNWGASEPTVSALCFDNNNNIAVSGNFLYANTLPTIGGIAVWNGSTFVYPDVLVPSTSPIVTLTTNQGFYLGQYWSPGATVPAASAVTVTNNGTAVAYPVITFTGPGTVYAIHNYTTGQNIYFYVYVGAGETAVLNLTPGNISFTSSFKGNILVNVLPGSNLSSFKLLPGPNVLGVFSTGGAGFATYQWQNRFWSTDGGA